MGWWTISSVKGGGIGTSGKLVNGDGPADILGAAIDNVILEYEEAWGRLPCMEEIQAAFNFVFNALPENCGLRTAKEMGLEEK